MFYSDAWLLESLGLLAGMISIKDLTANTIMFSIIGILFKNALELSFATSNLVGKYIGNMKPKSAKRYFLISLIMIFIYGVLSIIWNIPQVYVLYIYTENEEVIELVSNTIPLLTIMAFFDYC